MGSCKNLKDKFLQMSFQFIGFPSEWGVYDMAVVALGVNVLFPIYWVPQRVGRGRKNFKLEVISCVSNLLGSPASGEE